MEFRKSSTIYKKLASGRSFNDKSAYDGVFAAQPKCGTPVFSAGLEDYREIFGGSRGSSIPILDFLAFQEKKASIDVQNSKLEYSKVFGTSEELDFSVPYEELKGDLKKADTHPEKHLSTTGKVLPLVGKDSTDFEKDEVFSHEYQSSDEMKKFNMAYNKVNQGSNNSTKGVTHVVQLQATSGYTCILNERSPLQASDGGKPASKADDDNRMSIKACGSSGDAKGHPSAHLGRQTSRANGFQDKDDWYGNHSVNMKFDSCSLDQGSCSAEPTIFSRSAQAGKNSSYLETPMASKSEVCDACEKAGTVCSSPCFDEEVDDNSVAAASIAALRKAIEDAQAKIKIAKELMERRKDGFNGQKMSFADKLNGKERRESGSSYTAARSQNKKSQETCGKPDAMVNPSEIRSQNLRQIPEVVKVEIQSKNVSEFLGKEQFHELDRADSKPFENTFHDETITKFPHTYDQKQNRTTEKTIDNPEEFSVRLHRVDASNGIDCGEEKMHVVKEKRLSKDLNLAREMHFQEDEENTTSTIQKLDESEERVGISYQKEKCGNRENENQQKIVKDCEKVETPESEENTKKKEIKSDECLEDEKFKIMFKQNENERVEKVQMPYNEKNLGKGIQQQLEGPETFPRYENLESKKLDENSAIKQMMARDWVEYLKVKMGFKQDKTVIGEKGLMSYEKENCQERVGEPLKGEESVQEGQKLEPKELEELSVKQQVKGHEHIEDEKLKIFHGRDTNEFRGKDFVCGEDTDEKTSQVDELGGVKDCINGLRIVGERELKENGESRGNEKHQNAGEDEVMIADLSNQIEENGKPCEGKRIDLKFDKIEETDIKITQDGLNFCESKLEVTEDPCSWNLSENLNKNGGDHDKIVEETSNHPLCEDSQYNFDHSFSEESRNEMEVVEASIETKGIQKDLEEHMLIIEVEENGSLKTPFPATESSNEVDELTETSSSDPHEICFGTSDIDFGQNKCQNDMEEHRNNFTSDICAEDFASKVEELDDLVMEDEVSGSLQKEGSNLQSIDDKGLQSNIDDLNECYPLRMSEEKDKVTMAAEETITSTTIEVHQASETEEECYINDIFDMNNSRQAPQSEICENKKSPMAAIDDENDQVSKSAGDQEISDTTNLENTASDWPPLCEEDKFIQKTLEIETNQNVRVNEEKHQTTQTLEDMGTDDALKNEHGLESEVNNQAYAHTDTMNEGPENCFKIDEETKTEMLDVEGDQKQLIEPPKKVGTDHEFEKLAEVENGHEKTNDGSNESEEEKESSDMENEGQQQIVPPEEGETDTIHKSEILMEVEKELQREIDEAKEKEKETKQGDLENEHNQHIIPPKEGTQTEHEIKRQAEAEKEEQRKTDEVKEREKEKERERIAVERAIREARERAFSEARERVVAERASAQTRLKEKNTAREQAGKIATEINNILATEKASIEAKLRAERNAREQAGKIATEINIILAAEKASIEAKLRAERNAVERANAEAREKISTEINNKLAADKASIEAKLRAERNAVERANAEAREKINSKQAADKASVEAKLRAERNAVERATAEARERALEKAMSRKAFSEAKNLAEKIVEEKLSNAASDSERRRDFPLNLNDSSASTSSRNSNFSNVRVPDSDNSTGAIGETAQSHKAKLEKHQRTVERVAKALAEKNFRDRLAQQEQAERNRLAESLDGDVKRWSSGKEGNLRLLLSTLQYILGPNSGWQPIPLTEILATTAVKKAYRKATLWVHPDKLQQRGASIQQKYVCEKVFDLLQAAWTRFNAEER